MTSALLDSLDSRCSGILPLTARREPWMEEILGDPDACAALIAEHGSPVNLHDFEPLARNTGELIAAATEQGLALRVFVARKANKSLGLISAAQSLGLGVDVASYGELSQCLCAGMIADDLIVSAATKSGTLIDTALRAGVPLSLDNRDEACDVLDLALQAAITPRIALRVAINDPAIAPSRFGLSADEWLAWLTSLGVTPRSAHLEGVHFHLHGYSAEHRAIALRQACHFVDALRDLGHAVGWIDMGGGVPMRYLEAPEQWHTFWAELAEQESDHLTWRGDRLGQRDVDAPGAPGGIYPYWQEVVRGPWLGQVLTAPGDAESASVAEMLTRRNLELRCEPGRSVLDGCGLTLAEVAFRKRTSDGVPLVGLHMNRTQLRSTSPDFLSDPIWLRPSHAGQPEEASTGFLVGSYCIEEELILRRRLRFPEGVARGDLAAFVNTAGYLMHILESASHQIPLAVNLIAHQGGWVTDRTVRHDAAPATEPRTPRRGTGARRDR